MISNGFSEPLVQRVYHAAFSPDGARILRASWDKTGLRQARGSFDHQDGVYYAAFSPDGSSFDPCLCFGGSSRVSAQQRAGLRIDC